MSRPTLTRVEETTRGSAVEVAQDPQEVSVVNGSGRADKLTENMHCMGDVGASDSKID